MKQKTGMFKNKIEIMDIKTGVKRRRKRIRTLQTPLILCVCVCTKALRIQISQQQPWNRYGLHCAYNLVPRNGTSKLSWPPFYLYMLISHDRTQATHHYTSKHNGTQRLIYKLYELTATSVSCSASTALSNTVSAAWCFNKFERDLILQHHSLLH